MVNGKCYRVISQQAALPVRSFDVEFDVSHPVFAAHFPGNPITPGALLVQIAVDLLGDVQVTEVKNVKFLQLLVPTQTPVCTFSFTSRSPQQTDVVISHQDTVHARLSLVFTSCLQQLASLHACVLVPTYNNAGTLLDVLRRLAPLCADILVVNDGSTDTTAQLLTGAPAQIADFAEGRSTLTVVSYPHNQGKGYALREGFRKARQMGFDYAVSIDSDGQHYPEDLPAFARALQEHPDALIVGNRKLRQANMPSGNTFANHFSNFWFGLQTWQCLPDTQSGYRAYPLRHLHGLRFLTCRYEAELELMVYAAWSGVRLVPTPIRVYYPPHDQRVTHFRPIYDFARISLLNTVLCLLCFCYGWWAMAYHTVRRKCCSRSTHQ